MTLEAFLVQNKALESKDKLQGIGAKKIILKKDYCESQQSINQTVYQVIIKTPYFVNSRNVRIKASGRTGKDSNV